MSQSLACIAKVEAERTWRAFLFDARRLAKERPIEIIDDLEREISEKSAPPEPEPLSHSIEQLPGIQTPWVIPASLGELATARLWMQTKSPRANEIQDGCLIGFPRRHLSLHPSARFNQTLKFLRDPIAYERDAIGTSAFRKLIGEFDIQVFDDLSVLLRDERHTVSGASFEVSAAIAVRNPRFTPHADGSARCRWVDGDVVALKRPRLSSLSASGNQRLNQLHRIERSLINELRILAHAPLREHKNFVNLFGIAWEQRQEGGRIPRMSPVIVQSFATRGTLREYLKAMRNDKQLPWNLKMDICSDVLEGLAALHSCNIIHGDVKCENILLELIASELRVVAKLTDFGYSVIIHTDVEDVSASDLEIEGLVGTEAYMAPEVYRALEDGKSTLPAKAAFSSDMYSFGLAACEIALDGQDIFTTLLRQEVYDAASASEGEDEARKFCIRTKTNDDADELLLERVKKLIQPMQHSSSQSLVKVLDMVLRKRAEDRAPNVDTVLRVLIGAKTEEDLGSAGHPVGKSRRKGKSLATSFLHESSYELFFIGGKLVQLMIDDISVNDLDPADFTTVLQVVEDFRVKADTPLPQLHSFTDGSPTDGHGQMSLKDVATISFCAYQMFKCYARGIGVIADLKKAASYVAHSARGGYSLALLALPSLRDLCEPSELVDGYLSQGALMAIVSSGPRFGILVWLLASRRLRTSFRDAYAAAIGILHQSGYAELGETKDCYDNLDAEVYRGPGVEYQWIARGTMPLAIRLLPLLLTDEWLLCFENGCLPTKERNYNNETVLYMACRSGDAEKAMALLSKFEWAQKQVSTANKDGRTPMHWLCVFEESQVEIVARALLSYGADLHAVDGSKFRPIDYAVISHRDDVVNLLISLQGGMFASLLEADSGTLLYAINFGHVDLARSMISMAGATSLLKALISAVQLDVAGRLYQFGEGVNRHLTSLLQDCRHVFELSGEDPSARFGTVLTVALESRSIDFVRAILGSGVLTQLDSSRSSMLVLCCAAKWSQLDIFNSVLNIVGQLTLDDAHYTLGMAIQWKGPSQCDIIQAFITFLDARGLARDAVNYLRPGTCQPGCLRDHSHFFYPTQVWNAVDEGSYDVARILVPYEDTGVGGVPTTLWHVIDAAKPQILDQLDFLFSLDEKHRPFVCHPLLGANALHATVLSYHKYTIPAHFRSVLKTVLEWFLDGGESIDAPDKSGRTALHAVAWTPSLDAVEVLLQRGGADKQARDEDGLTAYDLALRIARFAVKEIANETPRGGSSVATMRERRPRETEPRRLTVQFLETLFRIMALLSEDSDGWRKEHAVGAVVNLPAVATVLKGLVPVSQMVGFTPCTESMEVPPPVQAWGCLEEGRVGFRVNIRLLSEFSREGLLVVAMETLEGRDGSVCTQFEFPPYLCRTEIYPIKQQL